MKKNIVKYLYGIAVTLVVGVSACTDYLDKAPESVIAPEDAFKNFRNFQGFVERMYHLNPDLAKHYWVSSFNWGEDEVITIGNGEYLMGHSIDRGNYRDHIGKGDCFLDRNWSAEGDRFAKSIWGGAWHGIRTANLGLKAIEDGLLIDANQEQRDFIEGQLYFLRGWFYFQITQYWGGMPYVETVLPSDQPLRLPRESYRENALKMAADFQKAAELLPINWDNTSTGSVTSGNNELRANKIWAMAMLGKTYLYAASPLMAGKTTNALQDGSYDVELAKLAADAFGEVLALVESGQTQYELASFDKYSNLFYTNDQGWRMPGEKEAIIRSPTYGADSYWRQMNSYQYQKISEGDGIVLAPAANYVNYFGMASGLPLDHPDTDFDPEYPWKNRDPRFYKNFVYDGVKVITNATDSLSKEHQYAHLYTNGNYIDPQIGSRTGYLNYKFIPLTANKFDSGIGYSHGSHLHLSWMRLADVYLMYAEAAAQGYGGANGKSPKFSKTAVEAINTIRARAGVGEVHSSLTGSLSTFMKELIRERAVELSFEGHRFNDLRRWRLLTVYPYNIKTRQLFDRAEPLNKDVDPRENRVVGWDEETIITRNLIERHYWLPIKTSDVSMYEGFGQNPGW